MKNMKKFNQYTKGVLFAALAVVGLSLTSCKDQPDKYEVADGLPTVNYIRCLSSEVKNNNDASDMHYTNGELVESASPQSTLCLVGDNLRSVYEIYFNDQKAVLNTSYMTDNTLIVDVPKNVPHDVTNKIYLYNRNGEKVEVDFKVIIPAPSIEQMSCEYASPGERVIFTGNYMVNDPVSPLEVYFKDASGANVAATINSISDDYTTIDVTIPETAVEGPVTMTSIYGTASSAFHYLDSRGMMFDFEPVAEGGTGLTNHGWHNRDIFDEGGISGHYVQLGNGSAKMTEDGGWDDSNFSFEYWCGDWNTPQGYPAGEGIRLFDLVDFSDAENMDLKFEMCIPASSPWMAGAMQIIFAPTDYVTLSGNSPDIYGDEVKGANNIFFRGPGISDWDADSYFKEKEPLPRALYRPWTTAGSYDTGGNWVTVTIPIKSSFVYAFDGSGLTYNLKKESFASLTMFVVGGGVNGTECMPIIKIDNIRAIPNK